MSTALVWGEYRFRFRFRFQSLSRPQTIVIPSIRFDPLLQFSRESGGMFGHKSCPRTCVAGRLALVYKRNTNKGAKRNVQLLCSSVSALRDADWVEVPEGAVPLRNRSPTLPWAVASIQSWDWQHVWAQVLPAHVRCGKTCASFRFRNKRFWSSPHLTQYPCDQRL